MLCDKQKLIESLNAYNDTCGLKHKMAYVKMIIEQPEMIALKSDDKMGQYCTNCLATVNHWHKYCWNCGHEFATQEDKDAV